MASQTKNRKPKSFDMVKNAAIQLTALTGRRPERVLGIEKGDDCWKVSFELLELQRLPKSTDVLGCYVVEADDDGNLLGYERSERYQRGHTDGQRG
jgi:hypothetical protein